VGLNVASKKECRGRNERTGGCTPVGRDGAQGPPDSNKGHSRALRNGGDMGTTKVGGLGWPGRIKERRMTILRNGEEGLGWT